MDGTLLNTYKDFSKKEHEPQSSTFEDKYYLQCGEVQKFKRALYKLCAAISFWKWTALEPQAERDSLREELLKQRREGL